MGSPALERLRFSPSWLTRGPLPLLDFALAGGPYAKWSLLPTPSALTGSGFAGGSLMGDCEAIERMRPLPSVRMTGVVVRGYRWEPPSLPRFAAIAENPGH